MNKSENINELAAALSRAQGAIKGALKDSLNPHFKAKYADLASTWDACREQLAKNELSVVQMPDVSETGGIAVETILMHSSGQWISSRFVMPLAKPDAHGVGSAITYARRYALAAMVGIAPEDDDGNKAIEKDDTKIKPSIHKPTDGGLSSIPAKDQERAVDVSLKIIDQYINDQDGMYETWINCGSNEFKVGVWELLGPHSKVRALIKKIGADRDS